MRFPLEAFLATALLGILTGGLLWLLIPFMAYANVTNK
jgi:hypothetical protein